MSTTTFRMEYPYSKFWLIFWAVVFFPVALVLLLTGAAFQGGDKKYALRYLGDRFWLGFWTIFFFPITFLLLFLNGIELEIKD